MLPSKLLTTLLPRRLTRTADGQPSLTSVLLSGVAVSTSSALLARVLSTVTQIIIARHLGLLLYGHYGTVMATLGLLSSLLGLGFDTWLLREGGRDPAMLACSVWHVLIFKCIGAVALLGLLSLAWSSRVAISWALAIGLLGVIFDGFAQTGYAVLRATRRNVQVAMFQTLAPLLLLGLLLGLRNTLPNILLIIGVQVTCSLLIVAGLMRYTWRLIGTDRGRFNPMIVLKGAGLFLIADILSNIYSQSGVVILGNTVGDAAVGIYRPAVSTITATFMIPNMVFLVGLPLLSAKDLSQQGRRNLIRLMAVGAAIYGLVMLIGFWFAGRPLIHLLYGRDFEAALPFIRMMSFLPLVKAGSFVCAAILLALNEQRLRVIIQSVMMGVSIFGGLLFIPRYGTTGAVSLYIAVESILFTLYLIGSVVAIRRSRL